MTHGKIRRNSGMEAGKLLMALFFILLVFVPLGRMLMSVDMESISKVFHAHGFSSAVRHSLLSTGAVTLLSLALAFGASLCLERTSIRCKGLFAAIFVLPMLIPSISHGMGLVILFGNNGLLSRLLGVSFHIYGMRGIILGEVLYSFPVAYLMLSDVMKYEDYVPYEAAKVLGIKGFHRFRVITFPYLRKPLISAAFAVFTMVITDYGVPLMVGGKCSTIASVMYQEVIGRLNFGKGAVYGCLLLIPAVIAFVFDALNKDRANGGYVTAPFALRDGRLAKTVAYVFCGLLCALVLLPLAAFCVLAFAKSYPGNMSFTLANIAATVRMKAGRYLLNSVIVALCVSLIGIAVAFAAAYMTARMPSKNTRLLHLASITSAAIPGVVLGLSYVLVFKGSIIYGTLVILILANLIHFFSSPYLMIYNALSKMNENLEAVGQTLGIGRLCLIRDVILPQSRQTMLEMFSYFFVNCMMTISAVSFLATTATKPVSLMINQFEAQMQLESAAAVSLMILAVNLLVRGAVSLLRKRAAKP